MKRAAAPPDRAFVLRLSPYGESDMIVALFTEQSGVVSAIARRARGPGSIRKRAPMLEPFHTLSVELAQGSGELASLRSATIAVPRAELLHDALAMDAAGRATRWTRTLTPVRVPEPDVFAALERALDRLAARANADATLATFGLRILEVLGYGLELGGCARCMRPRPRGRAAYVSGVAGGVLCDACRGGSAPIATSPLLAGALLDALVEDPDVESVGSSEDVAAILRVVQDAIASRARSVGRGDP